MLFESVTLHRRFPYAVLGGFLLLDHGSEKDGTGKRRSTFLNAHQRLRLFSGRIHPADRDEQYERLYVCLVEASPFGASIRLYLAGRPDDEVNLDDALNELLMMVAERNPDFYEFVEGKLQRTSSFR